jgi:hypothetical protein
VKVNLPCFFHLAVAPIRRRTRIRARLKKNVRSHTRILESFVPVEPEFAAGIAANSCVRATVEEAGKQYPLAIALEHTDGSTHLRAEFRRNFNRAMRWREVVCMLQIESSTLVVDVLPEVGGKIGQIRDKPSGREFLVTPRKPYRTIPLDGDWLQYDTSGMDDCFPNIAAGPYPAGPWAATQLPDLGEWTHGSWDVIEAGKSRVVLDRTGKTLPYSVRKAVRFVEPCALEFSYCVQNRGEFPMRYMWSAHPLISVDGPYELRLPAGDLNFRTFPSDGEDHAWPIFASRNLSREWIPRETDLKVFITGFTEGWCELRLWEHTLRFTFEVGATPVVGVWFNNFGFPAGAVPFRCIAVEPCTSPSDLLDDLPAHAYPSIPAGGSAAWSLGLQISTADREHSTEA